MKHKDTLKKLTPCLNERGFICVWDRDDVTVFENRIDLTTRIRIRFDHWYNIIGVFKYGFLTEPCDLPQELKDCLNSISAYKLILNKKVGEGNND